MGLKKLAKVIGTVAALSFSNIYAENTNYLSKAEANASKVGKYQELRKAGIIKGVLYNPSSQDLANIASNLFSQVQAKDISLLRGKDLGECVSNAVSNFSGVKSSEVSVFPLPSDSTYGNRIPRYIVFGKNFPSCFENENEIDLQEVIHHEVIHVLDCYFGMPVKMDKKEGVLKEGFLKEEVFVPLAEARADYYVLKGVLAKADKDKLQNSDKFFGKLCGHYVEHLNMLKKEFPKASEFEKQVIASALERMSDIVVIPDSDKEFHIGLRPKSK